MTRRMVGRCKSLRKSTTGPARFNRPLQFEPLEERRLLSITIDTTLDVVDVNDGVTSLREAIFAANTLSGADTIDFAPSLTAAGPATILLEHGELEITDALTINGPGANLLTIDASGNDPTPNSTLDDDITSDDGDGSRIFFVHDGKASSIDFTISALTLTGGDKRGDGGAIYASGPIYVLDCVLMENYGIRGGAIAVDGNATIAECRINENGASRDGGGLSASGSISVSDSEFRDNSAAYSGGGAIYSDSQISFIRSCAARNTCYAGGGAIYTRNGLMIEDSSIVDNESSGLGGGIYGGSQLDDVTVKRSEVSGNTAFLGGGGIYSLGDLLLDHVDVTSNKIIGDRPFGGGGILAFKSATIQDSNVASNSTSGYRGYGGGVSAESVIVTDSMIIGNETTGYNGSGGGIFATLVKLDHAVVRDNRTLGYYAPGGGIWSHQVTVNESEIAGNHTLQPYSDGGAIACEHLDIQQSRVTSNYTSGDGSRGGSVYCFRIQQSSLPQSGAIVITSSCFAENWTSGAVAYGGAIFVDNLLTATGSSIIHNNTLGADSPGGGVYCRFGASNIVKLVNSEISRNSTLGNRSAGGAIYGGSVILLKSVATRNETFGAESEGGCIAVSGSEQVEIVDSTLSGNGTHGKSSHSGGIYCKTNLTVMRSTIVLNQATGDLAEGGGIWSSSMFTNTFSVRDSIIADNFASGGSDDIHALGLIVSYSLIGNKSGTLLAEHPVGSPDANGNLIGGPVNGVIDPLLGPLADNGGLLLPDGTKMFTHALLPGSPAIDAGDPNAEAGVGDVPEFDQRGEPWSRVVGGRIDMGALEFQANPLPGDYNFNGVVDAADYTVWRDTSSSTTDLRADGSGPTPGVPDGVVDALDYAFWKSQFGNVLGPGAGSREQSFGEIAGELRLAGDGASASEAAAIGSEGQAGDSAGQEVGDLRSVGVRGRETRAQRGETFAQQVDARRSDALVHWLATRLPHLTSRDLSSEQTLDAAAETTADAPALDDAFELLGREGRFHRVFLTI